MQIKILLSKAELTAIIHKAQLIKGDELNDTDTISITIDDNRIAVEVPNMVRSMQAAYDPHNPNESGKD